MNSLNRRNFLQNFLTGAAAFSLTPEITFASKTENKTASVQKQVGYRTAIVKKYPEQLIVTIAKDKNGKPNPMTMGWTMITSGRPAMRAISMGLPRYTTQAIRHSKCFTIAFPSAEQVEHVLYFGTNSGRHVDKFAETGCRNEPAKKIDSVLLTDAVANFECKLVDEFITGDHIIFVGEVVASHINTAPKRRLYIIGPGKQLGPVKTALSP